MPEGILTYIHRDHEEFSGLITRILQAKDADERGNLFREAMAKLLAHSHVEQKLLYRRLEKADDEARNFAYAGENEHQLIERQLQQMAHAADKASEEWTAQARVLWELVDHHVKEEEATAFPCARRLFDAPLREQLGELFRRAKEEELAKA